MPDFEFKLVMGDITKGGIMGNYNKPVLTTLSMATKESMASDAFQDAFNSTLGGLEDEFIFSYDMSSMFTDEGV